MRYAISILSLGMMALLGLLVVPVGLWLHLPLGPWGNTTEPPPVSATFWQEFVYLAWRNPCANFGRWLGVKQGAVKLSAIGTFPNDYYGIHGRYIAATTEGRYYFENYELTPSWFKGWAWETRLGWKFIPPGELAKKPDYVAPIVFRPLWPRRMRG